MQVPQLSIGLIGEQKHDKQYQHANNAASEIQERR
jgi:hypothetical protein